MATSWEPAGNLTGPPGSDATATTDAAELTSGILSPERLPAVLSPIRAGSTSNLLTPDAARSAGGTISNITVTGDSTLNAPINPIDGQVLRYRFRADGANRSITFGGGIVASTGLALGPYPIPRGKVLICAIEYVAIRRTAADAAAPAWVLTAATVSG